jgi:hypothetical protein
MKKFISRKLGVLLTLLAIICVGLAFLYPNIQLFTNEKGIHNTKTESEEEGGIPLKDRMDLAIQQEVELTKDPSTNTVPRERLLTALAYAEELRNTVVNGRVAGAIPGMNWTERGPSNVGGRTRAIMVDPNDASGKKVFSAGVGGGIWKTNDINAASPIWTAVNDMFSNIAVTAIAYNPLNTQIMYFGTGEGFFNADAIRGNGIWKSTDGGITWAQLASTNNSSFYFVQRLAVHPTTGDVYAGTSSGLQKSTNGGTTWTKVLGSGVGATSNEISDIEISADNSIFVAVGLLFSTTDGVYKSSTGNAGSWTKLNTGGASGFPTTGFKRIELACAPSDATVVYAVTQNATTNGAGEIYRSLDGGTTWTTRTKPTDADGGIGTDFTRTQAWYDLTMAVDPNNSATLFIGGVDLFKSTNGASTWQQIAHWYGGFTFQEVHADQHAIVFSPGNSNVIYFGNDGGIWQTTNGTATIPTITSKSDNYNVTQFYACAMNPTAYSSQFIAGAQDNGSQQYNGLGINATVEVTGGDGCFTHIDQNEPQFQFTSYVYNNYYRSTNTGASFTSITSNNNGSFVNPTDYDNVGNNLYACNGNGTYYVMLNAPASATLTSVTVAAFNSGKVTHINVSPNTANRVFFGLSNGRVVRVDNANTTTPTATNIAVVGMPTGSVSCVAVETGNDNHLIATYSNYGVTSVWETTNGGTSWTSVEGNLPDMPVRWALFNPTAATQAVLATEVGVWSTDLLNGGATVWAPSNNGLANVRTDMLQIRTSDKLMIAATHGRGLFSSDVFADPYPEFTSDRRLLYTGKSVAFTDVSYKASSWNWDFGDGTTSTLKNPVKIFNTAGLFTVTLQINGSASLQRVKTSYIQVLPNKGIPFLIADGGSFDLNPLIFGADNVNGTPFERGNSAVAGKSGVRSGANAWVTGLTAANYVNNTDVRLWTPNYNFGLPGTYTLKFYRKNLFEIGWDGCRVEYSLDRGDTWIALGATGGSWYDFANTANATAFPLGQPYFNATKSTYTLAQYDVSSLAGNSSVGFRIRFKSDTDVTSVGLSIDDFEITGPVNSPLPVELASFTGKPLVASNELNWVTLSEINNDRFEIERSDDGMRFIKLGFVVGKGTTTNVSTYKFNDSRVEDKNYYYRLKQVDYDGKVEYSGIILIKRSSKKSQWVDLVYPNPFKNQFHVLYNQPVDEMVTVELFDLRGKLVYTTSVIPNGIELAIDVADQISTGTYLLKVSSGENQSIFKVFKQ